MASAPKVRLTGQGKQSDDRSDVVRLDGVLRHFIDAALTALDAPVDDLIPLAGLVLNAHRLHQAAALASPVAWNVVNVL